jgi:hypothetical protein
VLQCEVYQPHALLLNVARCHRAGRQLHSAFAGKETVCPADQWPQMVTLDFLGLVGGVADGGLLRVDGPWAWPVRLDVTCMLAKNDSWFYGCWSNLPFDPLQGCPGVTLTM